MSVLSVLIVMVNLLNSFPLLKISQLESNSCLVLMKCVFHELPCWLRKLQWFFCSKQIHILTSPAVQSQWWIIILIIFLKYQSCLPHGREYQTVQRESRPCE